MPYTFIYNAKLKSIIKFKSRDIVKKPFLTKKDSKYFTHRRKKAKPKKNQVHHCDRLSLENKIVSKQFDKLWSALF